MDIEFEPVNKEVIKKSVGTFEKTIQADIAQALSVTNTRKPSAHGEAANKVREYMSDKELLDLHLGNDVSELEALAKSLNIE